MRTPVGPSPTRGRAVPWARSAGRWMITFVGFPLGGVAAMAFPGAIDTTRDAVVGGLVTGTVLGAVQAWGLGRHRPAPELWTLATAVGLAVGLGVGATAVDFETTAGALAAQGAVCGLAVGAAQALTLRSRIGRLAFAWPVALAGTWALGWTITTAVGVQVDEQFTVFGSAGAVTVTALTAFLAVVLDARDPS